MKGTERFIFWKLFSNFLWKVFNYMEVM